MYNNNYVETVKIVIKNFEKRIREIKSLLTNESISLEERWDIYLIIRKYLPTKDIYIDFSSLEDIREVSWYDDFNLDRYAVQRLDENFIRLSTRKFDLSQNQEDSLKEEILKCGYGSFENDW